MNKTHIFLGLCLLAGNQALAQLSSYQNAVSALTPTLWYKFDEGVFGSTTPSAGSNTSTLSSANFTDAGDFWANGSGAMFASGVNGGLVSGSNGSSIGAGAIGSIVFLFKTDANGLNGTETLFAKGATGSTGLELLSLSANQLTLRFQNTNTSGTRFNSINRTGLLANTWYFSAITWDVSNSTDSISWSLMTMGSPASALSSLIGTGANAIAIADNSTFQIGGRSAGRSAQSSLDEFTVWTRRLSSVEINSLATATAIPEPASFASLAGFVAVACCLRRRRRS